MRLVFSTFIKCSQMTGVFYHSVIHSLGFFICFKIYTAVSRKVVLQTGKSLRDNVESCCE